MKVLVINNSPAFLSETFVDVMRKASVKQLKRKGFFEIPIDSPQFLYTLTLSVDSFNAGMKNFTQKTAVYSNSPQSAPYSFKHTVKAIIIDCKVKHYKQGWTKWENADDVYYFGEYRDIGRCEGMVRALIKSAKTKD